MTIAWVFPGQGSQKVGMTSSIMSLSGAKERFSIASSILGRDLLGICNGERPDNADILDLNDTRNTQPALFVVESLLVDDLFRQGRKPNFIAGHSLGEIVALYAGGVLDIQTSLNLLKTRSELMSEAGGGAMSAVMGFDRVQLNELVASTEGVVIANDNSSNQVVLSGQPDSVDNIINNLDCKRAIKLNVSGAFHSPFMSEAAHKFAIELDKISFNNSHIPILSNSDPSPTSDGKILKSKLKDQMTSGVRWRETMEIMLKEGVKTIVEIGPGSVLSGLAKRSMKGITASQVSNENDLGY